MKKNLEGEKLSNQRSKIKLFGMVFEKKNGNIYLKFVNPEVFGNPKFPKLNSS